ncbi:hypothetical protein R6242_18985 [Iodobacter sp. CM08]|uniref:hypothetical protein n=1 Tax=Iodobacter sp. CM08 TaxID=3085902 RepID=UPI002980FB66|nr:hypothetical protein [Iodobacter sp. CM08]MDW5418655.1 hypothetical protein [Iodobacter sp. CM08]
MKPVLRYLLLWFVMFISPLYFIAVRPFFRPRSTWRFMDQFFKDLVSDAPPDRSKLSKLSKPKHPLTPIILELHSSADALSVALPTALGNSGCEPIVANYLSRYPMWLHQYADQIERYIQGKPIDLKGDAIFTAEEMAAFSAYDALLQRIQAPPNVGVKT